VVPRYRQTVRTLPVQIIRPVRVDDEHFEISYHARHAAVPAPGGPEQLRALDGGRWALLLDDKLLSCSTSSSPSLCW
jgi:diacylglycerol O-acyltransferase